MHIMKSNNDNQALKSLCDGVTWTALGCEDGREVCKEVTAGLLCREVLQGVFTLLLAMQLSPASAEDGMTTKRQPGKPDGHPQWEAALKSIESDIQLQPWQEEVSAMLPSPEDLDGCYAGCYAGCSRCGRIHGEAPCSMRRCSYCWRNRDFERGLTHETVEVFKSLGRCNGRSKHRYRNHSRVPGEGCGS